MSELVYRSATALLADLAAKRLSARELLDAHVARNAALHAKLNIVVAQDLERAQRDAAAIDDRRARGEALGALAGLPMTIKDGFDVEGMPAVVGNPDWTTRAKDCPDADIVVSARKAGAVIWGKTNVAYMLGDWQSFNRVYGATNNPYDVTRTAGGSSGGSAAALASGISPLEIGSDIGGSLRVPANFCGIYALKPTWNLLPQGGHIPPDPGVRENPPRDLNVVGPMARNPGDLRLAQSVLSGLPAAATRSIKGRKVGVFIDQPDFPLSRSSRAAVERARATLTAQGADVRAVQLDIPFGEMVSAYLQILSPLVGAPSPSPEQLDAARRVRDGFKAKLKAFYEEGWDALLAPVMAVQAFPHNTDISFNERVIDVDGELMPYPLLIQWISLATSLHAPAVAIPTGLENGVPTGVQIIGRWNNEDALLDYANALDEAFGFQPPPL